MLEGKKAEKLNKLIVWQNKIKMTLVISVAGFGYQTIIIKIQRR